MIHIDRYYSSDFLDSYSKEVFEDILKDKLELSKIIDLISKNPRNILGLDTIKIEESQYANLTLFNPSEKWTYQESEILSMSKNTPFINYNFIGKPLGIINNGKIVINS